MKTKIFIKNSFTSIILELVVFTFGFFVPKLVIQTYGPTIHGLSASVTQIITLLQLLQAGAVGATIFSLYKPINEKNESLVHGIVNNANKYFNKIGTIFIILIILVGIVASFILSSTEIPWHYVLLTFLILGINGALTFFFISKYDIVLSAHQKRYVLTFSGIIEKIVYYIVLFIVIHFKMNFLLMYVSVIVGSLTKIIYLKHRVSRFFILNHNILTTYRDENSALRKYSLINSLSQQLIYASPILILSYFFDLVLVSVYSIYNMIQIILFMIINTIYYSVGEIIGEKLANQNKQHVIYVLDNVGFIYFIVQVIFLSGSIVLISPFVSLYVDNISLVQYIYLPLGYLIVLNMLTHATISPLRNVINGMGLYKKTYIINLISAVISIAVGLFMMKFNFYFLLLVPIFFNVILIVAYLVIIHNSDFEKFVNLTLVRLIATATFLFLLFVIDNTLNLKILTWFQWTSYGVIIVFSVIIFIILYVIIFERNKIGTIRKYIRMIMNRA